MTRKGLIAAALAIVLALLAFVEGCQYGRRQCRPEPGTRVDTVHVDRPLAPRDTARSSRPTGVTIYEPGRDVPTRTLPLRVPEVLVDDVPVGDSVVAVPLFRGLPDSGVRLRPETLDLTVYDFELGTWVTQHYDVPQRQWHYGVDIRADAYMTPDARLLAAPVSLRGYLGYRDTELSVGPFIDPVTGDVGIVVGVDIQIIGN